MKLKRVKHHVLRDFSGEDLRLDDLGGNRRQVLRDNLVAFTSLLHHPGDGQLYCGITAFNNDIMVRFDPDAKRFESLHYEEIAEPFEVKVHRSLELHPDGTIYGASACLYKTNERLGAPGGSLFKLAPGADRCEKMGIPTEHDYIQTISLDSGRGLIYGQSYPVFKFFVYHLSDGAVDNYDYLGSITHISAIDDDGGFWGTWGQNEHHLFRYHPDTRKFDWYHHGLPNARAESNMMYAGAGPVDVMFNGGDGYLYVGTTGGSLCRLDPKTAEVEYLGRPAATTRLPALDVWHDALLIGAVGDDAGGQVFAYDRATRAFHPLGRIIDSETGVKLYRVHDLALIGDTVYVAETDVPNRSGYLWECEIER